MYRRLRRGEFGNTLRTWRSSAEIPTDYEGEVAVRISVGTGGHFVTGIDMRSVVRACRELQEAGVREADMVWCEPFPDGDLVLQGEVMELAPHGLVLHWSDVEGLNMREAAAKGWRTGVGLAAREILRARLTPASYDDLMELLDAYPGHVVEFSAARGCVGPCRGRNMVTWEVRSY